MGRTIRAKVDNELTRHVGKWFTVRQIQDKLKINPSTLKPLIMKYARESVLRRRSIRGTARSVEFSPAATSTTKFRELLVGFMPYRNLSPSPGIASKKAQRKSPNTKVASKKGVAKKSVAKKNAKRSAKKSRR